MHFTTEYYQNALAYFAMAVGYEFKIFMKQTPGPNVIKVFWSVNHGFLYEARVFVLGKLFPSSLTNTLAYYENPYITDKKSFITLAPGRGFPEW
jgi:hypothetical protein